MSDTENSNQTEHINLQSDDAKVDPRKLMRDVFKALDDDLAHLSDILEPVARPEVQKAPNWLFRPRDIIKNLRQSFYPDMPSGPVTRPIPLTTKRRRKSIMRFARPFAAIGGLCVWSGLCAAVGWGIWASDGLPDTSEMWTEKRPASVVFLDRHNQEITTRGSRSTHPVNLTILPEHVPQALIAIEDRRYYYHPGFDPIGMVNAVIDNYEAGHVVRGGSTLSQQLAKNLFLAPERNMKRKSQEMLLALWLEHRFTKRQILELYLGRVYFGAGAWGIDAAAEIYFAKPASDLELGEAAMLIGLLKAPSYYSPHIDTGAISARATTVIYAMERSGYIDPNMRSTSFKAPILVEPPLAQNGDAYFIDWVWGRLVAELGEPNEDLIVRTTLDRRAQAAGEQAFAKHLDPARGASQAALVAMDGTGGVRAMIGGADYTKSQFNRAVSARRQPGSAFKPFVYLSAFRSGLRPWDLREDAPIIIDDWEPRNFTEDFEGTLTIASAFSKSLNTVAVGLSEEAGRDAVVATAAQFGLEGLLPLRSIALGAQETSPLELTQAYLSFANWGYKQTAYGIDVITNRNGKQLYTRRASDAALRVIKGQDLRDMNLLMGKTVTEGTGRAAYIKGRDLAGKTGTTNEFRDAWFMGYGPDYAAGVWVGNDDFKPMARVTGGSIPARIWKDFMSVALADMPQTNLPKTIMPKITLPPKPVVARFPPIPEKPLEENMPASESEAQGFSRRILVEPVPNQPILPSISRRVSEELSE